MSFLTAEWRKLALANYVVNPDVLLPYLPYKTELDIWQGKCYVSLVGFMFANTRLLGIPIPFHTNFEEVNLRFYVRYKDGNEWKRGVVFIKEIVPRHAIAFIANTLYKEHYQTMPMRHLWQQNNGVQLVQYDWKYNQKWQSIQVNASLQTQAIDEGSETEFITEHYWGYTQIDAQQTYEYQVTHPRWEQYAVKNYQINVDFGLVYGKDFAFLNQLEPHSVMLAEGSGITVESINKI
ncbi:MAG: DUF2071 domain-containing protein [Sphingobacteriales bacterium]|nr:DUF2071 domain-containing protein [Sphingobacteriales bacterium]